MISAAGIPESGLTLMFLWLLCYVPHFLRAYHVTLNLRKLKRDGKKVPGGYDLRSPRNTVNLATDDSERGQLIGRLGGAHNNREKSSPPRHFSRVIALSHMLPAFPKTMQHHKQCSRISPSSPALW